MVGGGIVTLLKKISVGAFGTGRVGGVVGQGVFSVIFGKGVAVEGGSPKSAAEVGKGAAHDRGRVGGLEDCRELDPDPPRS